MSMDKTVLDFSLILCDTIYDQCNRKMLTKMVFILIYLFFHSQLCSSKNKEEGKNKIKSNDEIKEELIKLLIEGEIIKKRRIEFKIQ